MCRIVSNGKNRFTGMIPDWLGELSQLRGLVLGENRFRGAIPWQLGHLHKVIVSNVKPISRFFKSTRGGPGRKHHDQHCFFLLQIRHSGGGRGCTHITLTSSDTSGRWVIFIPYPTNASRFMWNPTAHTVFAFKPFRWRAKYVTSDELGARKRADRLRCAFLNEQRTTFVSLEAYMAICW